MKSHSSQATPLKMELEIYGGGNKFPGRLPFSSKWKSHEVLSYTDSDDDPGAEPYYVYLDERKGWQITLERVFPEPESDEDEPDAPYIALTLRLPPGMEKAPDAARVKSKQARLLRLSSPFPDRR